MSEPCGGTLWLRIMVYKCITLRAHLTSKKPSDLRTHGDS